MIKQIVLIFGLIACAPSNGPHKPVGNGPLTGFASYDEVKPIFATYCSACHPARSEPDWLNFQQAHQYAVSGKLRRRAVTEKTMPPPGSAQAAAITDKERGTIARWIHAGAPLHLTSEAPGENENPLPNATIQKCFQCHGGIDSSSTAEPKIPRLAGQNESYLVRQLTAFKWEDRLDPTRTMNEIAGQLSDAEIADAARFYARLHPMPPMQPINEVLHEKGRRLAEVNCMGCHLNSQNGGRTSVNVVPSLSGQSKLYLTDRLLFFRNMPTSNPLMHEISSKLTNSDIEALAVYFSCSPMR